MRTKGNFAAIFSLLLLTSVPAFAQAEPPAKAQDPAQSCKPLANGGNKSGKGEPLGNQLSESKGVICPPQGRDSEIKVPPPDSGAKMPVIKPPGNAK